ncbi:MAG: LPS assembly lipoprotein LptE [Vicinamibacterales bacterium]
MTAQRPFDVLRVAPSEVEGRTANSEQRNPVLARAAIMAVLAVCTVVSACGYSLAGRGSFLPDYIRTIGVPQFANQTTVYDIDRRVSERVRSELINRGRYRVEPVAAGMDGVLSGEISSITVTAAAFNQQQQATRYVLTMTARVEFTDTRSGKVLWANPALAFREEFEPTTGATITDATAFFGQDTNAMDRIAAEFGRSVVSALMEAF